MKNMFKLAIAVLFLTFIQIEYGSVKAQSSGAIVGGAILNKKVDDVLKEAHTLIASAAAEGEASGVRVIDHAFNRSNLLLHNAETIFSNQRELLVKDIEGERQKILLALAQESNKLLSKTDDILEFGDAALISFESTINSSLLGLFKGKKIILQRLKGLNVLEKSNDTATFSIFITATDVGGGDNTVKSDLSLIANGEEIEFDKIILGAHQVEAKIKHSTIAKLFDKTKAVARPFSINIKQTIDRGFLRRDKVIEASFDTNLYLYPRFAGTLMNSYLEAEYGWVKLNGPLFPSKIRAGTYLGSGVKNPFTMSFVADGTKDNPKVGNKRITSTTCVCTSNKDGACHVDENFWGGKKLELSEKGDSATCSANHNNKWQTAHEFKVFGEEYKLLGEKENQESINVNFDEPFTIRVPAKNVALLTLKGELTTGRTINVNVKKPDASFDWISIQEPESFNQDLIYTVTLLSPK